MLLSSADFLEPELDDNHSMSLFINGEGEIVYDNFFIGDVVATPDADLFDGEFHSLRVTFQAPEELGEPDDPNPGSMFIQVDGDWITQGEIAPNVPGIGNHDVLVGTSNNQIFPIGDGVIEFVGQIDDVRIFDEAFAPTLISGVVDRSSGEVSIIGGEFAHELSFYELNSEGGALNPGPWSSSNLDTQDVDSEGAGLGQNWDALDATSNRIAEGFLLGSSLLDGDRTLSLGNAYRGNSGIEDLSLTVVNSLDQVFEVPLSYVGEPMGGTCGDFDSDGDVDAADRTIQTVGWTGALQGEGAATFADGDCDGDGDVDTADQTGLIGNWTGAMAGNLIDGDDADLVYDPSTGHVTIDASDTASMQVISFVLGTDQNDMNTAESKLPFIDAGTNTDNQPFQIGQTDPLNQGAGPLVDLGNILPTGMDLVALSDYLTIAEYASELGAGGTLDLRVVPEPSSVLLALLGCCGLIRRRSEK